MTRRSTVPRSVPAGAHFARVAATAVALLVFAASGGCGPSDRELPPPAKFTKTKALLDGAGDAMGTTVNVHHVTSELEGVRAMARNREAEFDRIRAAGAGEGR